MRLNDEMNRTIGNIIDFIAPVYYARLLHSLYAYFISYQVTKQCINKSVIPQRNVENNYCVSLVTCQN